jgi:hypothetical protein
VYLLIESATLGMIRAKINKFIGRTIGYGPYMLRFLYAIRYDTVYMVVRYNRALDLKEQWSVFQRNI